MRSIIYTSPFVPPEWIAAHGLSPRRIIPHAAHGSAHMGRCPFAQAYREAVQESDDAGAIFALTCDQMRRAPESLATSSTPVFQLDIPATWQSKAAFSYYRDELLRLSGFLLDCGGSIPEKSQLIETLIRYENAREQLRSLSGRIGGRAFAETAVTLHSEPQRIMGTEVPYIIEDGIPLALVAGGLLWDSLTLYDMLENCGGRVALDATALGERSFPAPVDEDVLQQSPFDTMAASYFLDIKAAFRRPNHRLYDWLEKRLLETKCRGIVFHSYTGCDLWHAEVERLRKFTPLPILALLQSVPDQPDAHTLNRLEAFVEALR